MNKEEIKEINKIRNDFLQANPNMSIQRATDMATNSIQASKDMKIEDKFEKIKNNIIIKHPDLSNSEIDDLTHDFLNKMPNPTLRHDFSDNMGIDFVEDIKEFNEGVKDQQLEDFETSIVEEIENQKKFPGGKAIDFYATDNPHSAFRKEADRFQKEYMERYFNPPNINATPSQLHTGSTGERVDKGEIAIENKDLLMVTNIVRSRIEALKSERDMILNFNKENTEDFEYNVPVNERTTLILDYYSEATGMKNLIKRIKQRIEE